MQKSKKISLAIIAIIIATIIGINSNTQQLKGSLRINSNQSQLSPPPSDSRFQAKNSGINKKNTPCNGQWRKAVEFIINFDQDRESTNLVFNKIKNYVAKGCDIKVQKAGFVDRNAEYIPPQEASQYKTFHCNSTLTSNGGNFMCDFSGYSSQSGTSSIAFAAINYNPGLSEYRQIRLIHRSQNFMNEDGLHDDVPQTIDAELTPWVFNIFVK